MFTLNNWRSDHEDTLKTVPTKYLCYGKETGESGTPHLQGFVIFDKTKALTSLKKLIPEAHWEIAKGTSQQASDYCKKQDSDFFESGLLTQQGKRTDLSSAIETLREGSIQAVAEEHPEVFVKYGRGLRDLALTLRKPYTHDDVRGVWIWGPPGTGKSHKAREDHPDAYLKPQSKWWDGYNGEHSVILDDLDSNVLGHYLKIWADKYACTGETKGGTVPLQHRRFVITSNYHPSTLWEHDSTMAQAIERRFEIIYKPQRDDEQPVVAANAAYTPGFNP